MCLHAGQALRLLIARLRQRLDDCMSGCVPWACVCVVCVWVWLHSHTGLVGSSDQAGRCCRH
jgi:hypothetical protein